MNKLGKIGAWIWVGVATIFAIGCLTEGVYVAALLSILSAAVAIPLPEIADRWRKSPVGAIPRALVSAVAWVASGLTFGAMVEPNASPSHTTEADAKVEAEAAHPEPLSAPTPKPTGYSFRQVDMYRDPPMDVCRRNDQNFAMALMGRIANMLPSEAAGTAQLDNFTVHNALDGSEGKEASLAFTARHEDGEDVFMVATGRFNPAGCKIGSLRVLLGSDPFGEPVYREAS